MSTIKLTLEEKVGLTMRSFVKLDNEINIFNFISAGYFCA